MRGAHDPLVQFADEIDSARSLGEMEAILKATLEGLGIRYFTYHILHTPDGTGARLPYIITTYPDAWIQRYTSAGYLQQDPVVGSVEQYRVPFLWSDVALPETFTDVQTQLMAEAKALGIVNGMSIPIVGSQLGMAALNLVGSGPPDLAERRLYENRHLFHLIALYFHHRAASAFLERSLTATSARRRTLLSAREREILQWIARGKSAWEVAAILGISEKGVEFHIEGAKRKLEVVNRPHAVARALVLGLISA